MPTRAQRENDEMIASLRQLRDEELEEARYAKDRYDGGGMDVWQEELQRSVVNAREHHGAMMRRVRFAANRRIA